MKINVKLDLNKFDKMDENQQQEYFAKQLGKAVNKASTKKWFAGWFIVGGMCLIGNLVKDTVNDSKKSSDKKD